MEKKNGKVIPMPNVEQTPADVAISRAVQNLFATYGEKKVRASIKELFSVAPAKRARKGA